MASRSLLLLAMGAALAPLRSQDAEPVAEVQGPTAGPDPVRVATMQWNEGESRRLFAAADADGDDRLDLFEATNALDALADCREIDRFRRLDRDADGYLGWAEFDRHYRDIVEHGGNFRVTLARPHLFQPPQAGSNATAQAASAPMAQATPTQLVLRLWDADRDGMLSRTEVAALLEGIGVLPSLVAHFGAFDRDGSGGLTEEELTPLLAFLPGPILPTVPQAAPSHLPPPWTAADTDGDGLLQLPEFTAALRRTDPHLATWARTLFANADANRDSALDARELKAAQPAQAKAVVEPRTHR